MIISDQATAFRTQSGDYLNCAEELIHSIEDDRIQLRATDPIDLLVGHAFELSLKSNALKYIQNANIKNFSHDILELFDQLKLKTDCMTGVSSNIAAKWRERLNEDREKLISKCGSYSNALTELGLPTENEIDTMHYALRNDVLWYSERMNRNGNVFRYHETRMDVSPQVGFWGINYHRPRQSLIWATRLLNN